MKMALFRGKFTNGHLGRFWNEEYREFPFERQPLLDSEIEKWRSMGYDHVKSFSGSMYDNRNPMPDWIKTFENVFSHLENKTYTFYKMKTLEIMPAHSDHYQTYMRLNNISTLENVYRIVVFLEDWKPGHYFEIAGQAVTNWIAGDWYMWRGDTPHAASNIGVEDRYTLQITGHHNIVESATQLHWFNFDDYPSKKSSTDNYFIKALSTIVDDSQPFYIYMLNRDIKELDDITHSSEYTEKYNKSGITFHLFEPLCSYLNSVKNINTHMFYQEFFNEQIDRFDFRAEELDSIYKYAQRNGLTNITVKTGDYNAAEWYPYYRDLLKIECDDLFLKSIPLNINIDSDINDRIDKKFISLNWRYTPHRHLITCYLVNYSGHYSFYFRGDFAQLARLTWLEWQKHIYNTPYFDKILKGVQYINQNAPLTLDISASQPTRVNDEHGYNHWPISDIYGVSETPAAHNSMKDSLQEFYNSAFVDIVTESRFAQPTANYSEKTYQPIQYKRPFILVAPPHTLKYLKEQGFKTFSDFWDESYDDEFDNAKRLTKIFDLIDYIGNKSIHELKKILQQMNPILEYNYNHFKTTKALNHGK